MQLQTRQHVTPWGGMAPPRHDPHLRPVNRFFPVWGDKVLDMAMQRPCLAFIWPLPGHPRGMFSLPRGVHPLYSALPGTVGR